MDVIYQIMKRLNMDMDTHYFELDKGQRNEFISLLWDELYQRPYVKSYSSRNNITPLEMEWEIVENLNYLKDKFINEEQYEETQIIQDLIDITQNKFNQIRNYADTTKNRGNRE